MKGERMGDEMYLKFMAGQEKHSRWGTGITPFLAGKYGTLYRYPVEKQKAVFLLLRREGVKKRPKGANTEHGFLIVNCELLDETAPR